MQQAASLDDWLTTEDVAIRFSVSVRAVTHMIAQGRLKASKKGWQLLVHVSDLPAQWPPDA